MKLSKTAAAALIFAVCCVLVAGLFNMFMNNTDIAEQWLSVDGVEFIPDVEEEEVVFSDESGAPRLDGVYVSRYTIPEDMVSQYYTVRFMTGAGEVEIIVNGKSVFSGAMTGSDAGIGSDEITFGLSGDAVIETRVRYTDPASYIFPALMMWKNDELNDMIKSSAVNASAIPAGVSGISFLILAALFLISVYYSSPDYSLAFLGIGVILFCVNRLVATGAVGIPPELVWLGGDLLPYFSAPCIIAFILFNRYNKSYRYFWIIAGAAAVVISAAGVIRYFFDKVPQPVVRLQTLAHYITAGNYDQALMTALNYLIVICMMASIAYHVRNIVEMVSERSALKERTRAVKAGYETMVEDVKETSALRHEWKHDLLTLSMLFKQGRTEEIGQYLNEKNAFLEENEPKILTGNFAFDTMLNSAAQRAKKEGVKFVTRVAVPPELSVREEDLCQLVMNMLENAFNACARLKEGRFIDFTAEMKRGCLLVNCKNSYPPEDYDGSLPNGFKKGYGMKNMEKVCRAYGSDLLAEMSKDGTFAVKTALLVGEAPEKPADADK